MPIQKRNDEHSYLHAPDLLPNDYADWHEPIGGFGAWNGQFECGPDDAPEGWELTPYAGGTIARTTSGRAGTYRLYAGQAGAGAGGYVISNRYYMVDEHAIYFLSGWFKGSNANAQISLGMLCYDANKAALATIYVANAVLPGVNWQTYPGSIGLGGVVAWPAGTRYARIYAVLQGDATQANCWAYVDNLCFWPVPHGWEGRVDVMDYGARGDAATDDSAAINRALAVAGNRMTFFPPGTYVLDATLTPLSGAHLCGVPGASILKAKAGAAVNGITVAAKSDVVIERLELDGNKANVLGNAYGILLTSPTDVTVRHCNLHDWYDIGLFALGTVTNLRIEHNDVLANGAVAAANGHGIFVKQAVTNLAICDNFVTGSVKSGIFVSSDGTDNVNQVLISNNRVIDNTQIGIYVAGDPAHIANSPIITGNYSKGNRDNILVSDAKHVNITGNAAVYSAGDADGDGIVVESCANGVIADNTVCYNRAMGTNLQNSDRFTVTGNLCMDNNVAGLVAPVICGIALYVGSSYNVVVGNICYDDRGPRLQAYGIGEVGAGANWNYIADNYVATNLTAGILRLPWTNTAVRYNFGHPTEVNGTATIPSGFTSVTVNHGLAETPILASCSVTPTNNMGAATKFWISALSAVAITISVDADPLADANFVWHIYVL